MFTEFIDSVGKLITQSQLYIYTWLLGFACLWGLNCLNWWVFRSQLNRFGIYPRRFGGLLGIILAPLLHHNFNHLFFNSIPLFVLGLVILAQGLSIFYYVTSIITVLGGGLVWLCARRARHIGASGIVSGYFGYLVADMYFHPTPLSILLGIMMVYYFGGIFLGIFPQDKTVSWESHLFGFVSGILSAV